jgi:hypothetical protein
MSSDDVLASCRRLFRRHDHSMQAVAELLSKARALMALSRDRLDSSAESLGKEGCRGGARPTDREPV